MSSLVDNVLVVGAKNRPPLLEKGRYDTWQSCMLLYVEGKEHGKMLLDSILKDLTPEENIRKECDIKASNVILYGLPKEIYTLLNHKTIAHKIWHMMKELMNGTKLTKQEKESKLADEFDRLTSEKRETIYSHDIRFVAWVKQEKNLREVSFNQLYVYLKQNEPDENKVRAMKAREIKESVDYFNYLAKSTNAHSGAPTLRRGRGKGYIKRGGSEVNAYKKKKVDVSRRSRTITIPDN
nr:hypothetical protein [Tanacetum cinerariifolium]